MVKRILKCLHYKNYPNKWIWQFITWEDIKEDVLRGLCIQVASIPTKNYREVIEIRVPARFYWDEEGFDGIEFGEFNKALQPWEEAMVNKCLEAIKL